MSSREQYAFLPSTRKSRYRRALYGTDGDLPQQIKASSRNRRMDDKYEVIEIKPSPSNNTTLKRSKVRLYGSRIQTEDDQIYEIQKETKRLEQQLARRQTINKVKYKLTKKQTPLIRSRVHTYSHDEINLQSLKLPQTKSRISEGPMHYDSVWEYPHLKMPQQPRKKVYRLKHKPKKFIDDTDQQQRHSPDLNEVQIRRFKKGHSNHPLYIHRLVRSPHRLKKLRKYVNAVLFTIKLRTFNERMRRKRLKIFKSFSNQQLGQKLLDLKIKIINSSKTFFTTIVDQSNINYQLHDKDEILMKKEKVISTLKLVNLAIKCFEKVIDDIKNQPYFHQTLYLLCKHGNYSCVQQVNTCEEMNIACVSQFYGYMRCDRFLEMSSLMSLVFIKIWLYNILLQPNRIDGFIRRSPNIQTIFSNIRLVGNIIYEILIQIQDQMFERCPAIYRIGNWKNIQGKFDFKISESMTLKEGFYQKNELISGLASHNYIHQIYKIKSLTNERENLITLIKSLHQVIIRYHLIIRKQSFIM